MTIIFFFVSFINNFAFNFNISQPLHMLFKSSSLITTFLMGFVIGKKYNFFQGVGVSILTMGILITTFADAGMMKSDLMNGGSQMNQDKYGWWLIGISLLLFALILSTLLGLLQEFGYKKWGRCQREAMFYQHLLSMFWFLIFANNLRDHFIIWSNSDAFSFWGFEFSFISDLWVYAILNIITQYICIRGVYMSFECVGSLTSNFILTCRKFLSILLSIWIFQNPWTNFHWIGTALVFVGTCAYVFPEFKEKYNLSKNPPKKIN